MADRNGSSTRALVTLASTLCVACLACSASKSDGKAAAFDSGAARPDSYPVMLNKDMPFRYPPALYAEKVQGNVTLRLYVDKDGGVVNDSTHIVESSTVPLLDTAALKGSRELRFVPAKLHGAAVPVSILFPVYFRHPEAPPPASDTMLKKMPVPGADSTAAAAASSAAKKDSVARKDTAAPKPAEKPSAKKHTTRKKTTRRRHRSD